MSRYINAVSGTSALDEIARELARATGKTLVCMSDYSDGDRPLFARVRASGDVLYAHCRRKNVNRYLPPR